MDSQRQPSALDSEEDNGTSSEVPHNGTNEIRSNGSCGNDIDQSFPGGHGLDANISPADNQDKGDDSGQLVDLPAESPGGSSPSTGKGYGLRKWRRIRRDVARNTSPGFDATKMLKRGLSISGNPAKPDIFTLETKRNGNGSVGSADIPGDVGDVDALAAQGSWPGSSFAFGPAFSAGADSENSDDRSSMSSTAASGPKPRHDLPAVSGNLWDKNRVKSLGGKSLSSFGQRAQQGKGRIETIKKPRGEIVKIEKENSHSSLESDSRSSSFFSVRAAFSLGSNKNQSERSMNRDGKHRDEAEPSKQQFGEDAETVNGKDNEGEVEQLLKTGIPAKFLGENKVEKDANHESTTGHDILAKAMSSLQSVQDALEKEVQKLGEIGKEALVSHSSIQGDTERFDFASTDLGGVHKSVSSTELGSEKIGESIPTSLRALITSLREKAQFFEQSLQEARVLIEAKESRVAELEATICGSRSPKEESGSTQELPDGKTREAESELERLFKQKIEAEVEYLAISNAVLKLKDAAGDKTILHEEQKILAEEQTQMATKLGETRSKAAMLKKLAKELEDYSGEILGTEEVWETRNRAYKVTSCFLIQLMFFILVFSLFISKWLPHSGVVVPT